MEEILGGKEDGKQRGFRCIRKGLVIEYFLSISRPLVLPKNGFNQLKLLEKQNLDFVNSQV
jgi:hypothetical protein